MQNQENQNLISLKDTNSAHNRKVNKRIEIVYVPKPDNRDDHQENVGIELDEKVIHAILSTRYRHVVMTKITQQSDLDALALRDPDLVFSGVKYFEFDGQEIWLNDFLDVHNIAYMASNRAALNREHDKCRAKEVMQLAHIKTARFFTAMPDEYSNEMALPIAFPLFIKPVSSGDSVGIDAHSIVNDFASFQAKVLAIFKEQHCASLVETYLSGKEYSVGILEDGLTGNLRAMPIEIIAEPNENGHRILDFDVKRLDLETVIAVDDATIHQELSILAKRSFKALGGKSLGRIDIRMNQEGVPHFVEANLMPGLRGGYFYRSCLLNLEMNYETMILTIAQTGLLSKLGKIHAFSGALGPVSTRA